MENSAKNEEIFPRKFIFFSQSFGTVPLHTPSLVRDVGYSFSAISAVHGCTPVGMADPNAAKEPLTINGKEYEPLADGTYDAVVLGTGLTECILSGLLSVGGLRVLHCDRNDYYGGKCASLNMKMMVEKFAPTAGGANPELGESRDYNIDLIPKFIMAGGSMVDMLLHTGVTRYLEFKLVDGSFGKFS